MRIAYADPSAITRLPRAELERQVERYRRAEIEASTREGVLLSAAMHVVRYGKLGKQSRARLQAAIRASQLGRTY